MGDVHPFSSSHHGMETSLVYKTWLYIFGRIVYIFHSQSLEEDV